VAKVLRTALLSALLLVSQVAVAPVRADAAAPAAVEAAPPGFAPGTTTRVSVSSTQAPANGNILSSFSSVSVDGDYVTFASNATNLVPGVIAGTFQVYIHRRSTGVTDIVSLGGTSPAQQAFGNAVSEDGNFVAFDATAPDLVDGDDNNTLYVFRRDMRTGVTRLVTANQAGEIADKGGALPRYAGARGISTSGRYIVFSSPSTNLVPGPIPSFSHVYVKDMDTGAVVRASVNSSGAPANANTATASISGNGRFVVMSNASTNLSPLATNGTGQIYVRDLDLETTTLESVKNDGLPNLMFAPGSPVISNDGRYVAFDTQAVLEGDDHDAFTWDVYLRDRIDHTTQLVSRSANTATFVDSRSPAISGDGNSVAFGSLDGSIVAGDTNGVGDVYLYDRETEEITLVSLNTAGVQASAGSSSPSVSDDGSAVLFASTSSNLVTTPASSGLQLYVREFTTNTPPTVVAGPHGYAFTHQLFTRVGSILDPDVGQTWTGTVDYGDGSAPVPLTISADRSFVLTHFYSVVAIFSVRITVTDSAGATGGTNVLIDVQRTPLIFVPGLLGSVLVAQRDGAKTVTDSNGLSLRVTYSEGQVIWPNLIDIVAAPENLNILRFQNGRPITDNADDIVPNGDVVTLPLAYADVQPFFESHGYRLNESLFYFTYDWRYSVESHNAKLDERIAGILAATGSPAVDVIAHSMGTQVMRAYLSGGTQVPHLRRVVLAGGPSLGTPKGTFALTHGLCFPELPVICRLEPRLTQYLLSTLPGVVEMGVSPAYYDLFDGRDGAHPVAVEERLGPLTTRRGDYAYLRDLLRERGVSASLIDDAEAFHSHDLTWLARVPSAVDLFVGTGECTFGTIIKRTSLELDFPVVRVVTNWDFANVDGDGTVVRQSASLEDADVGWSRNAGHRVVYRPLQHYQLASNDGLATALDLLRDEEVADGAPRPPFVCFTFSVHSPAEVVLTDGAGRRVGSPDGKTIYLDVPEARYDRIDDMKVVTMTAADGYTAQLRGTADGEATVRIRTIDTGLVSREIVYRHVPTTTNSVGTLVFDTGTGSLGALEIDLDGDGTRDLSIAPDELDATSASDETGPSLAILSPLPGQAVVGTFNLDWSAIDSGAGIATSFAVVDRGTSGARTIAAPGPVSLPPGPHVLEAVAEDRAGNPAIASVAISANGHQWLEPIGDDLIFDANEGRTIPGRFRVTTPSGAFVTDTSVTVVLEDSNGQVVVGPLRSAASASEGVAIEGDAYHVNVPTRGLGVGMYRIVVSFDSPTLVGQFSVPVRLR
jgi:pimeloyl-ACP methyl ester carboxylesterase